MAIEPSVSVVVASFRARALAAAAVESLVPQCARHGAQLVLARRLVADDAGWFRDRFPSCEVVACDPAVDLPRIRGAGLAAASGSWVALTEDNCLPEPDWLSRLVAMARDDVDVVAGSMAHLSTGRSVDWAAYFAEYGFFGPGRRSGPSTLATGANVAYRRELVGRVAGWFGSGDWEDVVHARLVKAGARFILAPDAIVRHQLQHEIIAFLRDRFIHGRDYAGARGVHLSRSRRLILAAGTPVLPLLLTARAWNSTGRLTPWTFFRALPATIAFLAAWAAGEATGYLLGRAARR